MRVRGARAAVRVGRRRGWGDRARPIRWRASRERCRDQWWWWWWERSNPRGSAPRTVEGRSDPGFVARARIPARRLARMGEVPAPDPRRRVRRRSRGGPAPPRDNKRSSGRLSWLLHSHRERERASQDPRPKKKSIQFDFSICAKRQGGGLIEDFLLVHVNRAAGPIPFG